MSNNGPYQKTSPLARQSCQRNCRSESSNTQHPLFDLSHINKGTSHPLHACVIQEKAAFADKLAEISLPTWQDLTQAPRHGLGFEKIETYPKPAYLTEDINIIAFRFDGKKSDVRISS